MSEKLNITLLWLTGAVLFADIIWLLSMMCQYSL